MICKFKIKLIKLQEKIEIELLFLLLRYHSMELAEELERGIQ